MLDLKAMSAPTDSESADAQYNADIWELRSRITELVEELAERRYLIPAMLDQFRDLHDMHNDPEGCPICGLIRRGSALSD